MKPPIYQHRNFQIAHTRICVSAQNRGLLDIVGNWLKPFGVAPDVPVQNTIRFTLIGCVRGERIPYALPRTARLVHENEHTKYYDDHGLWIVVLRSGVVLVNRATNRITAFVYHEDLRRPSLLEDVMHPLVELLRQCAVYAQHAGAVSRDGQGLLLLGKSGQGKTTLAVDLLSHGFDFLADDRCFLTESGNGVEMYGYYEPIRYFPANVDHIQAIGESAERQRLPKVSNNKSQLDLSQVFSSRIVRKSRVAGLVFPQYSPNDAVSRVDPVSAAEALLTILPLTMVCFDQATSKKHFEFCARLTTELPAVKLVMGRDRERWHVLMEEYLDRPRSTK